MREVLEPTTSPSFARALLRGARQPLQAIAVSGTLLFAAAGRLDVPSFWASLGIHQGVGYLTIFLPTFRRAPELWRERWTAPAKVDGFHRRWRWLLNILLSTCFLVAGLDLGRLHLAPPVPLVLLVLGAVVALAGAALVAACMLHNEYFSSVVRVQHDRGHRVATHGPYRIVRHPGYVGILCRNLGGMLLLGSWPAFFCSLLFIPLYVARTRVEDRLLLAELDGYHEYAAEVRFRLVPGIW